MLADGKIVGWFDGRMEFGPRALGQRSILGDPRNPRMQADMNIKIKFREGFRPFAPSVLREKVREYFDLDRDSPYMLLVAPVQQARRIAPDGGTAGSVGHRQAQPAASPTFPRSLTSTIRRAFRRSHVRRVRTTTISLSPSSS